MENKYLDQMAYIFGFGEKNPSGWTGEDDLWAESPEDAKALLKGEGIEITSFGDPGDSMFGVFEDGELKLTAYVSTRGAWYQAGAYDGEKFYGASNISEMSPGHPPDRWTENQGYTCSSIARDAWKYFTGENEWGEEDE